MKTKVLNEMYISSDPKDLSISITGPGINETFLLSQQCDFNSIQISIQEYSRPDSLLSDGWNRMENITNQLLAAGYNDPDICNVWIEIDQLYLGPVQILRSIYPDNEKKEKLIRDFFRPIKNILECIKYSLEREIGYKIPIKLTKVY